MKLTTLNNAEIVIQANVEKEGDFDKVREVAKRIIEDGFVEMDIASEDTDEQWIHLCAVRNNFQMADIKEAYKQAKR